MFAIILFCIGLFLLTFIVASRFAAIVRADAEPISYHTLAINALFFVASAVAKYVL
jgi:hypothetical protein